MKTIIHNLVDFIYQNKDIDEDRRNIYEYGAEAFLSSVIDIIITIIIGLCFGQVWQALFYITVFFAYRQYSGGYHANNHFMCKSFGIILLLSVMILIENFNAEFFKYFLFAGFTFSFFTSFIFAPVEHQNKPLTKQHKRKARKICIIFNIFGFLICLALSFSSLTFAMMVLCAFTNASFLIIVAKIINSKENIQNEKN
jgi:accessory gene regulator B